jgi:myo-inositol 2-dehydrogenase/D-chiro-inositol 1-dehydrogenase
MLILSTYLLVLRYSVHIMSETRRVFMGGAGLLVLQSQTAFGSQANSALEVGIVGCGGRGAYIGRFFKEFTGARIVALADPFQDRMDALAKEFAVDSGRLYGGMSGYEKLAASKLDAVVIESPPYFHPEQAEAAVDAGKHVYCAKPVAVDVPGCLRIERAGKKAAGKLSFMVDFQTRAMPAFQEAAARVHRGEIGTVVLAELVYHARRNAPQKVDGLPAGQARLRNWLHDKVLSGDMIVEQNIHTLDVGNWYLQGHPTEAYGVAGRKVRLEPGDVSDHFLVDYWYPNDTKAYFAATQFLQGYGDIGQKVFGSKGTLESHYGGSLKITGENPWPGVPKDDTFKQGAINNVKAFVDAVRAGKPVNNAAHGSESTLTAILGRTAAYRRKVVTWDEMIRANERTEAKL